jgi:hypothetical protein
MEKIQSKYNAILSFCEVIKSYLDEINDDIDTQPYDKVLSKIIKTKCGDDIFYKLSCAKIMMTELDRLIYDIHNILLPNISDTRRASLATERNKIQSRYNALSKEINIMDFNNMDEMETINIDKIIEYRKFYHNNTACITIYATLMQKLIDYYYKHDKPIAFKLLDMIEDDKDLALKTDIKSQFSDKLKKKNPIQHRYGLLPVSKLLPLKTIISLIATEVGKPASGADIGKIASKLKVGIIVFNKIVYKPVDFNPRPLIIEEDAKPYIQDPLFGINEKVIDRFNTIIQLKDTNKWNFSIDIYNKEAATFYILETIDGENYKLLAPWLKSDKYGVARFRVHKIISHNNISRAVCYHNKKLQMAIPNMFTKKMLDLESVEDRHYEVDSTDIRNSIITDIMKTIHEICAKKFKKGFESNNDIINLLHDPAIVSTYINSSLIHYSKGASGYDGGDFNKSEILATFLVMLQETGRRLSRELHNGYFRNVLSPDVFKMDKTARDNAVMEKILNIIENTMMLIIKLDSNPFVHIYTKYIKLNFDM